MCCQRNSAKTPSRNTSVISMKDNPTIQTFGYNDLNIAAQRSVAPVVQGNVQGRHKGEDKTEITSHPGSAFGKTAQKPLQQI